MRMVRFFFFLYDIICLSIKLTVNTCLRRLFKMFVCIKKNDIDHGINSLNLIMIIRFKELIP